MLRSKIVIIGLISLLIPIGLLGASSFARVASLEGDLLILRPGAEDWEYAGLNDLIEEGAVLRTEANSFAKIETEKGIFVFLDQKSQVDVEILDKNENSREIDAVFKILEGRVVGKVPKKVGWDLYLSFKNPVTEVILPERAVCEVKSYRSGTFLIKDIKGKIQVRTPKKITYLSRREILQVDPEGAIAFKSSISNWEEDAFESWCSLRLNAPPPPRYMPVEIDFGYYDLNEYGEWIYVPGYGYVWRPYVDSYWRPYYYGHWTFSISFGWVWVPYEPWGWVPFHYGHWAYVSGCGWIWIPGTVWGPGWVVWSWGPDWVAWCPMGPYGRPIYGIGFSVWTVVELNSFTSPRYRYKAPHRPGPDPFYKYKKPRRFHKPKWGTSQPPFHPKGVKVSISDEKGEYFPPSDRSVPSKAGFKTDKFYAKPQTNKEGQNLRDKESLYERQGDNEIKSPPVKISDKWKGPRSEERRSFQEEIKRPKRERDWASGFEAVKPQRESDTKWRSNKGKERVSLLGSILNSIKRRHSGSEKGDRGSYRRSNIHSPRRTKSKKSNSGSSFSLDKLGKILK